LDIGYQTSSAEQKIGKLIVLNQLHCWYQKDNVKDIHHINQNLNNESIFLRTEQEFSLPKPRRHL